MAYQYGGGAGFESPLERDPGAVLEDVWDEYVSPEAALERYGVVVLGSAEAGDLDLDEAATRALRDRLAAGRQTETEAAG
jgi:N-methylhydantoinase B